MGKTDELAAALGDEGKHGLERIENTREGDVGDLIAPGGAIKIEIGAP